VSLGRDTDDAAVDLLVENWLKLAAKLEHAAAQ